MEHCPPVRDVVRPHKRDTSLRWLTHARSFLVVLWYFTQTTPTVTRIAHALCYAIRPQAHAAEHVHGVVAYRGRGLGELARSSRL